MVWRKANSSKPVQIYPNMSKLVRACPNPFKNWSQLVPTGTLVRPPLLPAGLSGRSSIVDRQIETCAQSVVDRRNKHQGFTQALCTFSHVNPNYGSLFMLVQERPLELFSISENPSMWGFVGHSVQARHAVFAVVFHK